MAGVDSALSLDEIPNEIFALAASCDFQSASILLCTARKLYVSLTSSQKHDKVDAGMNSIVMALSNCERLSGVDVQIFRYSAGALLAEMILCAVRHKWADFAQKWCEQICFLLSTPISSRKFSSDAKTKHDSWQIPTTWLWRQGSGQLMFSIAYSDYS